MFTEALTGGSLSQTELDEVFRQNYEASEPPSVATAFSAEVFKPMNITHAAWIGKVHRGPGFFTKTGEVGTVAAYQATVANKYTILISDWTESIDISKNLYDDRPKGFRKLLSPYYCSPIVAFK